MGKAGKTIFLILLVALGVACSKQKATDGPRVDQDVHAENREKYGLHATTTLWGFITDQRGEPVGDVVVTDGFKVAKTDSKGLYQLAGSQKARFVYYTTPAHYAINVDQGNHPDFYAKINKGTSLFRQDFKLTPAPQEDKWTLLCIGDPQTTTADNVERFRSESLADIDRTVKALREGGQQVYAITLGDIVHDKPDLFPTMKSVMSNREVSFFQVLGNHDHTLNMPDATAHEVYENHFGPRNYSFDRGNVHIVAIDNYINLNNLEDKPTGGLTDEIWAWLQADLAQVPKSKMVILCAHVPFKQGTASTHGRAVVDLLKTFAEAHIMTGHTHTNFKWKHDQNPASKLTEHVHGTTCGAHWRSNVCLDGTPNGYAVYNIEDNHVADYYYKATGEQYDRGYQMRLYDGGYHFYSQNSGYSFSKAFGEATNSIVANIWNADNTWQITLEEVGYPPVTMQQTTEEITDWSAFSYHLHFKDKLWTGETNHYWQGLLPSGKEPSAASFRVTAKDVRNGATYTASSSPEQPNIQFTYEGIAYP